MCDKSLRHRLVFAATCNYAPASESMCTRDLLISFVNDTLMSSVVYEIYFIFDEWPDILVVALKSDEKLTF